MSDITEISQRMSQINTGKDKKEDALMVVASSTGWERMISPAPFTINLLGQLMLLTTDNDFSLANCTPKGGFKEIRYPESLRACLMQVANNGWSAFNKAHTNMDKIRLQMLNVSNHIPNIVRILLKGTNDEIEIMLPGEFNKVKNIADECCQLVINVETEFLSLMELTKEILEASTNARGEYEQKVKDTRIAIQTANLGKQRAMEEKREADRILKTMEKEVKDSKIEYENAMNSVPGAMKLFVLSGLVSGGSAAMGMAETLIVFGALESMNMSAAALPLAMKVGSETLSKIKDNVGVNHQTCDQESQKPRDETPPGYARLKVLQFAEQIHQYMTLVGRIAEQENGSPDWDAIKNGSLSACLVNLENLSDIIQQIERDTEEREQILVICKKGIHVCNCLDKLAKQLNPDKEEIKECQNKAKSIQMLSQRIAAEANILLSAKPINSMPPKMSQKEKTDPDCKPSANASVVEAIIETARFKAELAQKRLKDAQERYDKAFEESKRINERNFEFLKQLSSKKIEEIDFESIRQILIRGIEELAKLREQWGKLVRFFQMMSNIINVSMTSSVSQFVDTSKQALSLKHQSSTYTLSDLHLDLIYEQASTASKIAYIVNNICSAYVEISDKYLMDKIAGLGRLLALDPEKDRQKIYFEKEQLNQWWNDTEQELRSLLEKRKAEFDSQIQRRTLQIETEMKSYLPLPAAKVEAMQQSIDEGFSVAYSQRLTDSDEIKQWD